MTDRAEDLARIAKALESAAEVLLRHAAADVPYELKEDKGLVTAADREVDELLRTTLPQSGDGWLSEETPDDRQRIGCRRVWICDPLDGTRSFVAQRPEYSVSIALVEDGVPVLGGVCNPVKPFTAIGGPGLGVSVEGDPSLDWPGSARLRVLASRSERRAGLWQRWDDNADLAVLQSGSVAYKLALVAAGAADASWTVWPKNEWDVAAGVALVRAAGGTCWLPEDAALQFNQPRPRFAGLYAAGSGLAATVRDLVG
ncbi:MAG: inositol monophosphatase family protein [Planctomycetota bacterium]|nr:inositol monophosphatase family protein [Planctomycetota bacterium]